MSQKRASSAPQASAKRHVPDSTFAAKQATPPSTCIVTEMHRAKNEPASPRTLKLRPDLFEVKEPSFKAEELRHQVVGSPHALDTRRSSTPCQSTVSPNAAAARTSHSDLKDNRKEDGVKINGGDVPMPAASLAKLIAQQNPEWLAGHPDMQAVLSALQGSRLIKVKGERSCWPVGGVVGGVVQESRLR